MPGSSDCCLIVIVGCLQDSWFYQPLSAPPSGLPLKTRVFAAVKATNLDKRSDHSSQLSSLHTASVAASHVTRPVFLTLRTSCWEYSLTGISGKE